MLFPIKSISPLSVLSYRVLKGTKFCPKDKIPDNSNKTTKAVLEKVVFFTVFTFIP
jgi:hypothetical protein